MRVHSRGAAVLLAAVVCIWGLGCQRPVEYRTFTSPDGRLEVVVYRIPVFFAAPGQASDAPGLIQLRDSRTGRVSARSRVEMVQLVEQVEWSDTSVTVGRLADWKLPR